MEGKATILLALLETLCFLRVAVSRVSFVSLHYGNTASSGYMAIIPGIQTALEDSLALYPSLLNNYTWTAKILNNSDCTLDGSGYEAMAGLYRDGLLREGQSNIVIVGTCPQQFVPVGDFGRELDFLALPCTSDDASMRDKHRYPTTVTFAQGAVLAHGRAFIALMDRLGWKTVAVINDYRQKLALWLRTREQCRGQLEELQKRVGTIQHMEIRVNDSVGSVERALVAAKGFSRIIISCMLGVAQKELLTPLSFGSRCLASLFGYVEAHGAYLYDFVEYRFSAAPTAYQFGMTNGDYVFIHLYQSQVAGEPPLSLEPVDYNDTALLSAFASLIVLRSVPDNWMELWGLLNSTLKNRVALYGPPPFPFSQRNGFMLACYEAVRAGTLVLAEEMARTTGIPSGRALASGMFNRTFSVHLLQPTYINSAGARELTIVTQFFSSASGDFETAFEYDSYTRRLSTRNYSGSVWKMGLVPPDRPACGLQNELCVSVTLMKRDLPAGVVGSVATLMLIVGAIWWRTRRQAASGWWMVTPGDVVDTKPAANSAVSVHHSTVIKKPLSRKYPVWIKGTLACPYRLDQECASDKLDRFDDINRLMSKIAAVQHLNVNLFVGLILPNGHEGPILYESFCSKGSVDDVIDRQRLDDDLKFSFLRDLLSGLEYIRKSPLKWHGNLRLTKCLVDPQLTVKISSFTHAHLAALLVPKKNMKAPTPTIWTAPEVAHGQAPTPKSDVYSFGVIARQILYEGGVSGEAYKQTDAIDGMAEARTEIKRAPLSVKNSASAAGQIARSLQDCLEENPEIRPALFEIRYAVLDIVGQRGLSGSLFDRVSRRLERYFETLEDQVVERQLRLEAEQKRCDELLEEMLPREIVKALRQIRQTQAEEFGSVTVAFTSVIGFAQLAIAMSPMLLLDLLTQICASFDGIVSQFSVYKVETISDIYLVACGLPVPHEKHTSEVCEMALRLQAETPNFLERNGLQMRAGIHTGPVAAGVIGYRRPRYCLFGDTVNTASRLETHGLPLHIHVSELGAKAGTDAGFVFKERGMVDVKGKGLIRTFWLKPSDWTPVSETEEFCLKDSTGDKEVPREHVIGTI